MPAGTVVASGSLVSPGGQQGIPGPNAISSDSGNLATFGSDSKILVPQSSLWSMRLRSFNAVGNPNFEVDQRNCFATVSNNTGSFAQDRWVVSSVGTLRANTLSSQGNTNVYVPGTSYLITQSGLQITVATPQASLGAGDYWVLYQIMEGPQWRELSQDVTSISLMVYSTIANQKFSVFIRSSNAGVSMVNLCTIPTANTWTLLQVPNIPKPTSGTFPLAPGGSACTFGICLACGTTYTAPAAGTWQTGNFFAASGTTNFFATAGAQFYCAFVQHEPGAQCTTLIDKPFTQNLDECLRYFQKSYDYATQPGTSTSNGVVSFYISGAASATSQNFPLRFPKRMAKAPTMYCWTDSGVGNAWNIGGTPYGISSYGQIGETGMGNWVLGSAPPANTWANFHYTADTGF